MTAAERYLGDAGTTVPIFAAITTAAAAVFQLTATARLRNDLAKEVALFVAMPEGPVRTERQQLIEKRSAELALRLEERRRPWIERYHPTLIFLAVASLIGESVAGNVGATKASIKDGHPIFHSRLDHVLYADFKFTAIALAIGWMLTRNKTSSLRHLRESDLKTWPYSWLSEKRLADLRRCLVANNRRDRLELASKGMALSSPSKLPGRGRRAYSGLAHLLEWLA